MSKFTFICEQYDYDEYTGEQKEVVSKTTKEFYGHTLEGILDEMTTFLRGAGYHFDGHLDVVSYEDLIDKIDEQVDEFENDEQSRKVMQHIVQDLLKNPITLKGVDDPNPITVPAGASDTNFGDFQINLDIFEDDIPRGKCEVCGLDKQMMIVHNCYDDNCPIHATKK